MSTANNQSNLTKIVEKISLFHGLAGAETERVLRICNQRSYDQGARIYDFGEQSDEMLIILSGRLSVRSPAGDALATIGPGAPVGEMGVFTGEPRSARVLAIEPSNVLAIGKAALFELLESDRDTHFKVLQNLVHLLCRRINEANQANAEHAEEIIHLQDLLVRYTGKTAGELE